MTKDKLNTGEIPTWCPGCFNFQIMAGVKNFLNKQKASELKKFAIVAGIGCHAKIYDALNLPGLNSLHGRVIPTCLGLKIGNPNLNVLGFSGDGDAYSEGMEHLIHACRYNANFKYLVHNNQVFALTIGEPTAVTEEGFKDKSTPFGVFFKPVNPIKLMLASGATFVARVFADPVQVEQVLNEAFKHKGFAFIEVLQPCLIFHSDKGYKERTYNLQEAKHNYNDIKAAMEKADEFDYNSKTSKIPLGIFYRKEDETFEEKIPPLFKLMKQKKAWKDIKR
jgi:2-oxoglutarate/2-oxoacid ferredoxin oxidoreductase subunit beta